MGESRHGDRREDQPPGARIRNGLGVRDHEEREQQQRAALELVHGDRQGIAEPERPRHQQPAMCRQEEKRDVGAPRPLQHHDAEEAEQGREPQCGAPLARRHPGAAGAEEEHDDGDGGGIEDMLAVDADRNLEPTAMTAASA